jgi:hypothetical protein
MPDTGDITDAVQRFHEQQCVGMRHNRAFREAHPQAVSYMPGLVLVSESRFAGVGDLLSGINPPWIKFNTGAWFIEPVGQSNPGFVSVDICFGSQIGRKGAEQLRHGTVIILE